MKNFILISCFLLLTASVAQSQSAFQKKDIYVNAGISLINYRNFQYNASERGGKTLPVFASAEYGINHLVSFGPFAGYYSRKYYYRGTLESVDDDLLFKSHYTTIGLKSSFHFTPFLEDKWETDLYSEDLDLYASLFLGYEINRITRIDYFDDKSRLVLGGSLGARYFLNYRMALFAEIGPGILGFGAIGATARF